LFPAFKSRYYDPEVGRFISEDTYEGTIANPLSLNLYTYCYNDPISYIDPSGHMGIGQFFKKFLPGMAAGFTGFDELKNLFTVDTFWGMVQFGEAVIKGDITIKDLASSVGASMIEPFKYLFDHSKEVWTGNPSDAAVYEYGKHMGNVIQMVVGTVAGGGALGAKLMDSLGKVAPKLCKIIDKVASQESILRKLPFCFTGDTLVYTDSGLKEIKDIKVGDQVYAENPETGEKVLKNVTQVYINETDTLIHVTVGETDINTTPNHPFYVEGKGWILAGALEEGDKLHLYSGEEALVKKVTWEVLKKKVLVYNLEVEDFHTYYVSDLNVLVHNDCKFLKSSELNTTHSITMSKNKFKSFVETIKNEGIKEPIKYVEYNGHKYVVDGHHRLEAAKQLGIKDVPVQKVELPYGGYKTVDDLFW
jgi:hypothetical protein